MAMARTVLAALPPAIAMHARALEVEIADCADDALLAAMGIDHPLDLTGLYHGRPLTQRSIDDIAPAPDRVTLYRIPILVEWAETGVRLDDLVRHVLIHEIGHHFGFSDGDMAALEA